MRAWSQWARPYAKAAFEFAQSSQTLAPWRLALKTLSEMTSDPLVRHFIQNPTLSDKHILEVLLSGLDSAPAEMKNLLLAMAERHRLIALPQVYEWFLHYDRAFEHVTAVEVTSAQTLSSEIQEKMKQTLLARFGGQITIEWKENANLMGGAIIRAGDNIIDGSLRTKLTLMGQLLKG